MARTAGGSIVTAEESDIKEQPHIEGSRITVSFVQSRVEEAELQPETVADRHNLDLADIYAALAYYHDNPGEMERIEKRREEISQAVEERSDLSPPE